MQRFVPTLILAAGLLIVAVGVTHGSRMSRGRSTSPEHQLSVVRMRAIAEVGNIHRRSLLEAQASSDATTRAGTVGARLFERVSSWSRRLPESHRETIVAFDAWDNPLYIACGEPGCMVVSLGPDGEPDLTDGFFSMRHKEDEAESVAALEQLLEENVRDLEIAELTADDLLVWDDNVMDGAKAVRGAAQRTMADLRSLGTAVETYSIDNNFYPHIPDGRSILDLVREIEPIYIRTAPQLDGWRNPFLYLGDRTDYMIISFGADGRPDVGYRWPMDASQLPDTGATQRPERDIVFSNGQFVLWPEGEQQ